MVLDDIYKDIPKAPSPDSHVDEKGDLDASMIASPKDRLAAVVADFVVLMPLISLAIAPAKRLAQEAKFLGNDAESLYANSGVFVIGVLAVLIYQTFFVSMWGATPGKMLLRLRVVSDQGDRRLTLSEAFWRSFAWCLELALGGAPWLSVFSNERRRPLHDRVAETSVIALTPHRRAGLSTLPEMSVASGFQSAVLACALVMGVSYVNQWRGQYDSNDETVRRLEASGRFCPEVREALTSASTSTSTREEGSEIGRRMDAALSLYEMNELDSSCLTAEADFALMRGDSKAEAYLAKALLSDDEEKSEKYFAKACPEADSSSDVCAFVKLTQARDSDSSIIETPEDKLAQTERDNDLEKIGERVRIANPASARYLRVAMVEHWMAKQDYAKALDLLDSSGLGGVGQVGNRLNSKIAFERARALWQLDHRSEARLAYRSANDVLNEDTRVEMSRWFCAKESAIQSCSKDARAACDRVATLVEDDSQWLMNTDVSLSYIRSEECRIQDVVSAEKKSEMWSNLRSTVPLQDAKALVDALAQNDEGKTEESRESLSELAKLGVGSVSTESTARLIQMAQNESSLAPLISKWEKRDWDDDTWKTIGQHLARRATDLHAFERALKIGLQLVETDPYDRSIYRELVVASFEAGHRRMAEEFLQSFRKLESDFSNDVGANSRLPASADSFARITRELDTGASK